MKVRPYQRALLVCALIIGAIVIAILALPAQSPGAERAAPKPMTIIHHAREKLAGNTPDSIKRRFLEAVDLLTRGEAWEPKARILLAAIAVEANAVAQSVSPYTDPKAQYPSFITADACFVLANAKLYYTLSTMRVLKGNEVVGRTHQETASLLDDVVASYRCSGEALAKPATLNEFKRILGSERAAADKIKDLLDIIRKNIFEIQQGGAGEKQQQNQQGTADSKDEEKAMKAILGDNLGKGTPKDTKVVPPRPQDEPGEKKYAPGTIGGT